MKNFLILLLSIFFVASPHSEARPAIRSNAGSTGIIVSKQGKSIDGKWFTLNSQNIIEKVEAKYYRQNAVFLKLKSKIEISNDKKSIKSPAIQSALAGISVGTIDLPFEKYTNPEDDEFGISKIYQINYDLPIDPYIVCEELMKNPEVEYATPIFIRYTHDFSPDDPRFKSSEQYFLDVLKMRPAWDITKGSKDVKIAIVDSAIDWLHEDLNGNIWTNSAEIAGNKIDDDANGFVDDIHGWDFVGNYTGGALLPDNDTKSPDVNNMHGTHTSGCASAVTNNTIGVASVGFNCSIIPVKVGADMSTVGGIITGYEGILYAANLGADVINCSWGGPGYSPAEEDIVNSATAKGSVVVVSAGNSTENVDNNVYYPASFKNAFTVGSTNSVRVSTFSGYGVKVDIFAPGENILSTVPGNDYTRESGTSMSAPIVAGLIGLLKSIHPDWTPQQLMHQVRGTAQNNLVTNQNDRPYYFGMANALAALTYNNGDPEKTIPGISMENVSINGKSYIGDFDNNEVSASFKNYLSPASDVVISFIPMDSWVVIEDTSYTIPSINTDEVQNAMIRLRVTEDCPWFSGTTKIIVKITSGTYTNFELITLPINLPTNNTFATKITSIANMGLVQMNAFSMIDETNGWLAGNDRLQNQGLFARINGGSFTLNFNATVPVYAVYGFNSLKAIMGTGTDDNVGTSSILITSNGGGNWSSVNTSNITTFINFIHFYDDMNGIFLGDPLGTTWGVGVTTDGGNTWTRLNTLPPAQTSEDGLVGSGSFAGDEIWFGTTMGRVFYSPDKGQTWSVSTAMLGKAITDLCFMSSKEGIVVLSDDLRATSNRFIASTSDFLNWKVNQSLNFTALGLFPVYSFSPIDSKKIYMLFSSGEVFYSDDMWNSYKPELTKQYDNYVLGDMMYVNDKVRLWEIGTGLTYLDFFATPASIVKKITLAEESPVDFGTVQVTKSKTKFIKLQNTGNSKTTILSGAIIPGENTSDAEFDIKSTLPVTVDVGVVYNLRSGLNPVTEGSKSATLRLVTDGEPANLEFEIIGNAEPLSVYEIAPQSILSISPNPVAEESLVRFESKYSGRTKVSLIDYTNKEVWEKSQEMMAGMNEFKINSEGLSSGMYLLIIEQKGHKLACKVIVN